MRRNMSVYIVYSVPCNSLAWAMETASTPKTATTLKNMISQLAGEVGKKQAAAQKSTEGRRTKG